MWRRVRFWRGGLGIAAAFVVALAASAGSAVDGPEAGLWREKVRVVWDEATNASARRPVRVFDPHPELDLDFHWEPYAGAGTDAQGTVYGPGRLTWRQRGSAAWDGAAITSEYVGEMSDGRPHGAGRITLQSGLSYDGEWRDGLMDGRGHLRLPTGDDYEGELAADRPHGSGRYTSADGTSFDGPFRNGQREGTGVLTLADGTAYRSRWANGREVERTVLAQAQAPPRPAGPAPPVQGVVGAGGVVINLFVDRQQNTQFRNADPDLKSFVYEGQLAGNELKLRLDSQELMGLWKGDGTIYATQERHSGALFEAVEQFAPVFLVVDVTNERGQAVQIDGAYLDVERSFSDLQPYLIIHSSYVAQICDAETGEESQLYPTFELVNAGWGPVRNASVRYAFGNESGPRTQSYSVRAGNFTESTEVTTLRGLEAAGLDMETVPCGRFACESEDQLPSCLAELEESGIFGELAGALFLNGAHVHTRAWGRIDYTWVDAQGASHQRQSPIAVDIGLLQFDVGVGAEEGAAGPVERNIRPVELGLDRNAYRVPLGIRGQLAARQNRRFALSLAADKSSAHFFKVALQLADGSTVSSPRVDLLYFRPQLPQPDFELEPEP